MSPSHSTRTRKNIQNAAQAGDLSALRVSIDAMYGDNSPFNGTQHHMTPATFIPFVEAAILSKLSGQDNTSEELVQDMKHLYGPFGLTHQEYAHINTFLHNLHGPRTSSKLEDARRHFAGTTFSKLKFVPASNGC